MALNDKELIYGYKELILYFEQHLKNQPKGFNSNSKKWGEFLSTNGITIAVKVQSEMVQPEPSKRSFFYFTKSMKESTLFALYRHLRNAYSHGAVGKIKIGNKYYFSFSDKETYGKKKGQYSMFGQIPCGLLSNFVKELQNNKQ